MTKASRLVSGEASPHRSRVSLWPARMDLLQSGSGLFLALFMWGHMIFVSSILISKDLMWTVTRFFEGYFLFGKPYPGIVSAVVALVLVVFVLHAFLALRKFPADYRQYRAFLVHRRSLKHSDTSLWWLQVVTGFLLFFLASPHLFQMLMHPDAIGPHASSERVWSGSWWPLYLALLFCVELHGGVGLYRLAVKWGWFEGSDAGQTRRRLKRLKWGVTGFLLVLGLLTLAAYMKIGHDLRDSPGTRYIPAALAETAA